MANTVEKIFSLDVDTAEGLYNKKFVLDKNIVMVRKLIFSSNNPKLLFFRGTQRLEINGEEVFPENYESKLLMAGLGVPPDEKFKTLDNGGVIAGNGEIKLAYKDTNHNEAVFTPYKVNIILKCEIK
jgi:hypothetical protein